MIPLELELAEQQNMLAVGRDVWMDQDTLTICGKEWTLDKVAAAIDIPATVLQNRKVAGMSDYDIVATPLTERERLEERETDALMAYYCRQRALPPLIQIRGPSTCVEFHEQQYHGERFNRGEW